MKAGEDKTNPLTDRDPLAAFSALKVFVTGLITTGLGVPQVRRVVDGIIPKRHPWRLVHALRSSLRIVLTYRCNLSCEHCYSRHLESVFEKDIDFDAVKSVLAWARRDGKSAVRLLGGEPTLHPRFSEIVRLCRAAGLSVTFATNNTFGEEVLAGLSPETVTEVCVNVNAWDGLDDCGRARFEENLSALRRQGVRFRFSYVIGNRVPADLLVLACSFRPDHVRLSLPLPAALAETEEKERIGELGRRVSTAVNTLEHLDELGVSAHMYRPVPDCLIGDDEQRRLGRMGRYLVFNRCCMGYGGDFALMMVVNPDLTVTPCASLMIRGPKLSDTRSSREVSMAFRDVLIERFSVPPMEACATCARYTAFTGSLGRSKRRGFFDPSFCQGGCLCYR